MDEIEKTYSRIGPSGSLDGLKWEFAYGKVGVCLRQTLTKQVLFFGFGLAFRPLQMVLTTPKQVVLV